MTDALRVARNQPLAAILFMCATAVVLFPVLNTTMKHLTMEYSVVQVIFVRGAGHMLLMLALFLPGRGLALFHTRALRLQLLRSSLQGSSSAFYVVALALIPLTTATVVAFTAPLMVVALSARLLGERVGPYRWIAVVIGLAGALIIIRPGAAAMEWADLLVIASAACYAFYQLLTRRVARYDDSRTTAAYTIVAMLVGSALIVPFVWKTPDNFTDWGLFVSLGLSGGLGHYFMVKAYEYGEASIVGPFDYGQLVGATVLGYLAFGEFPDRFTWIGAAILIGSGLFIAHREALHRKRARQRISASAAATLKE
jgi:drug/metabolite transporter (DMT)-like permease